MIFLMIKIILAIAVVVFTAGYRWDCYKSDTMYTDKDKAWHFIKNFFLFVVISLVAIIIIFSDIGPDDRTMQHYEPRF